MPLIVGCQRELIVNRGGSDPCIRSIERSAYPNALGSNIGPYRTQVIMWIENCVLVHVLFEFVNLLLAPVPSPGAKANLRKGHERDGQLAPLKHIEERGSGRVLFEDVGKDVRIDEKDAHCFVGRGRSSRRISRITSTSASASSGS